jgi:hypothetical protein
MGETDGRAIERERETMRVCARERERDGGLRCDRVAKGM